jgi:putative ABC transport system permease protein
MIALIKIALRNLIKNRRRSLFTILAIALGFSSVSLFGGFASYLYHGNREMAVLGTCNGHLLIFKKGFLQKGQLNPGKYLIMPQELEIIRSVCKKLPQVVLTAPHLMISGLLSNGRVSTIFIGQGITPSDVDVFMDRTLQEMREFEGKNLVDGQPHGAGFSNGLARLLDLKVGSDVVAFTNTVDGQMNALDLEVFQLFDTPSEALNDKMMRVPLKFAQNLYDTEGVDRVAVLLDTHENTELVRSEIQRLLSEQESQFEIMTWEEMSQWYKTVKEMFDVIFAFLFIIVFIIVVTSVINTMSMAVIERTREIGTLRALGLKRRGVTSLFAAESFLLGLFGTVVGLIITFLSSSAIDIIRPTWMPPAISKRVPIMVLLSSNQMLFSFVFLILLCLAASLLPARRAARQNVVDALGHV